MVRQGQLALNVSSTLTLPNKGESCGQYMVDVKCDCQKPEQECEHKNQQWIGNGAGDPPALLCCMDCDGIIVQTPLEHPEPFKGQSYRKGYQDGFRDGINECINALPARPFEYPELTEEYIENYIALKNRSTLQALNLTNPKT